MVKRSIKELREGILAIAPIFAEKPFFMNDEFSLVDCCVAPILWRLTEIDINLPERSTRPLTKYMNMTDTEISRLDRDKLTQVQQTALMLVEKVKALGQMWRNVAGAAAGAEPQSRDVVLEALEERRDRFSTARTALCDPDRTAFLFVTVPERLPILETHRIMTALSRHGIPVGGVIVNQLLPDTATDEFLVRRKAREAAQLADIEARFEDWPLGYLPLLDRDPVGADQLLSLLGSLRSQGMEDPA